MHLNGPNTAMDITYINKATKMILTNIFLLEVPNKSCSTGVIGQNSLLVRCMSSPVFQSPISTSEEQKPRTGLLSVVSTEV